MEASGFNLKEKVRYSGYRAGIRKKLDLGSPRIWSQFTSGKAYHLWLPVPTEISVTTGSTFEHSDGSTICWENFDEKNLMRFKYRLQDWESWSNVQIRITEFPGTTCLHIIQENIPDLDTRSAIMDRFRAWIPGN